MILVATLVVGMVLGAVLMLLCLSIFASGSAEDEARARWIDDELRRKREESNRDSP